MIDFKEIPSPRNSADSDKFELFARSFLSESGYEIIQEPGRGPDGGIDIKIKDVRVGKGKSEVFVLVSCKHYANSGKSVGVSDEVDIMDRLQRHNCTEFMCFYSTNASSGLISKLKDLEQTQRLKYEVYDGDKISIQLMNLARKEHLLLTYFKNSYSKFLLASNPNPSEAETNIVNEKTSPSNDDLVDAALTANVIMEVSRIKRKFIESDWLERHLLLQELNTYSDFHNLRISKEVIMFLETVSGYTRSGMTTSAASSIDFLVLQFFPHSNDQSDKKLVLELCNRCIGLAYKIIFNSIIYLGNLSIAECGMSVIKSVQEYTAIEDKPFINQSIQEVYNKLLTNKDILSDDLILARELIAIYKEDLKMPGNVQPYLPERLYERILLDEQDELN